MNELFRMLAVVEVLGVCGLPLTITVFHHLPDRGWPLSKAISLAWLAFCVWLPLMCFHSLSFSQPLIAAFFLLFMACGVIGFIRTRHTIAKFVRVHLWYIVVSEVVFIGMVYLLGWLRSYGPDIRSYEMFMDEGFLAAIMRSSHFPPNDMWLAGYPINYYYYAHYTIALLAKLLGQMPSVAFNTGICIFFGLTAVGLLSVTCNIVTWTRQRSIRDQSGRQGVESAMKSTLLRSVPYGCMTVLMGMILGNLAATQEWWENHGNALQFNWFTPSRVIDRTINEFPAFSFLLSCFHAHVLTLAFTVVAVALALNLFFDEEGKDLRIFGQGWHLPLTMGTTAMILGGLYVMNGWDFPTYMGLTLACIALQHWLAYQDRLSIELILDLSTVCLSLVALAFLLYAPFYFNFVSPSQGIGIVTARDRSPLGQELLIYGLFVFIFLSMLFVTVIERTRCGQQPETALPDMQTVPSRGWLRMESIVVLFVLLVDGFAILALPNSLTLVLAGSIAVEGILSMSHCLRDRSLAFTILLGSLAFGLIALCEVIFLKDVFASVGPRTNTIFKFYFQSWTLLAITCGAALAFIPKQYHAVAATTRIPYFLQHSLKSLWTIGLLLLLLAGAVYPLAGPYTRYVLVDASSKDLYFQRTDSLDGLAYLQTCRPPLCAYDTSGDYAAIRWLNSHISGDPVIVEAVGGDVRSNSSIYARVAAFTGLPTLMGWADHEYQWRVNWMNNTLHSLDFKRRKEVVDTIYTNPHSSVVLKALTQYHAQYLYVGFLEKLRYPHADLQRFGRFMQTVYSAQGVTIYKLK